MKEKTIITGVDIDQDIDIIEPIEDEIIDETIDEIIDVQIGMQLIVLVEYTDKKQEIFVGIISEIQVDKDEKHRIESDFPTQYPFFGLQDPYFSLSLFPVLLDKVWLSESS